MSVLKVSVLDHGAVSGIDTVQTEAFQAAIDACFLAGGGEVVVPEGSYVIGDIRLRSNITLHLMENAVLLGSLDPKDYTHIFSDPLEPLPEEENTQLRWISPRAFRESGEKFKRHLYTVGSYWNYGMIRAAYAQNIAIVGEAGAQIDGRNVYDPEGEQSFRGPHGINMHHCKNLTFRGYTIKSTGNWAHAIFQSEDLVFDRLVVEGGHDAIHPRSCANVTITDCDLKTGDDAVAGFDNQHVLVKGCRISSACSAFRFGGYDILIEDCDIYSPCPYQARGTLTLEEKQARVEFGSGEVRRNMLCCFTSFTTLDLPLRHPAGKIVMRNCVLRDVGRVFHLNLSGNETWQQGDAPTDVTFENVRIENCKTGFIAYGTENVPFHLNLKNVTYSCHEAHEEFPLVRAAHFEEIKLENVKISNYRCGELVKSWTDGGKVVLVNTEIDKKDVVPLIKTEEEFVIKKI